jgi:hypothetical protein
MAASGVDELLRLQRRAVKLRGLPPEDSVLSPAEHDIIERSLRQLRDDSESPSWLLKYLPNPPTPLQDWADWLILAEGLTALEGVLERIAMPPAWVIDSGKWRAVPQALSFGQWIRVVLTAGDLTVGSVPTNALHASTRKVSDGYLVVVKQGLLLFVRELVTIYEFAGRKRGKRGTADEVARRLESLLDTHARYGLSGPRTRDPEFGALIDFHRALYRVMAMTAGLSVTELMVLITRPELWAPRYRPGAPPRPQEPRGLTRDILAPLFVVLHELAHIYHGDADMSAADAARLEAEYDALAARAEQEGSVLMSTGPPGFRSEWWADSEAIEAIIEMQRFVRLKDPHPRGLPLTDVNVDLQTTALESAYLAMIALHLVHEKLPQTHEGRFPASRHPDTSTRFYRLGQAAVYDAEIVRSLVEEVDQTVDKRLGPAIRRVLGHR